MGRSPLASGSAKLWARLSRPQVRAPLSAGLAGLATSVGGLLADLPWLAWPLGVIGALLTVWSVTAATRPLSAETVSQPVRVWALPQRLRHFTGRGEGLAAIESAHSEERRPDIAVLWGLAAVGKTSLALEYAHRVKPRRELIAWITATERRATLAGLAELGRELGVVGDDLERTAQRVLAALHRHEKWLLVFDDATPDSVHGLLPTSSNGDVLITSRSDDWTIGTVIHLDVMPIEEAAALLLARSEDRSADAASHATALAERLGGLALALDLAGAYCRRRCTLAEYREQFGREGLKMMRRRGQGDSGPNDIAARLSATDIALRDPAAGQLLRLLAFFGPGYLPQDVITKHPELLPAALARVARQPEQWLDLVDRLHAAGLLRAEPGQLWSHQLTLEAQQDSIAENTSNRWRRLALLLRLAVGRVDRSALWTARQWSALAQRLITHALPNHDDLAGWPRFAVLLPHGLAMAAGPHLSVAWVSNDAKVAPAAAMDFRDQIGLYYTYRGDSSAARDMHLHTLSMRQTVLGVDHPATLIAANNLANVLRDLGELDAARDLHRRTLDARRRVLGDEHQATLSSGLNLAITLHALGHLDEARDRLHHSLESCRRILGDDHPYTHLATTRLAFFLHDIGELREARDLHRTAFEARRKSLTDAHASTLGAGALLAEVLCDLGELTEARDLFRQIHEAFHRLAGAENPSTLDAASGLAGVLRALGELAEARDFYQGLLEVRTRQFGEDHPTTVATAQDLADVTRELRESAETHDLPRQITESRDGADKAA